MWRESLGFNRAETFALALLLLLFCIGGGIYLYQKTTQTLPTEMIIAAVEVAESTPAPVAAPQKGSHSHPKRQSLRLNINTAPAESLALLPEIGPVISSRIVSFREASGGFDSVGQLVEVKGIGSKRLAKLRHYLHTD